MKSVNGISEIIFILESYKFLAYLECIRIYAWYLSHSDPDPSSVVFSQKGFIVKVSSISYVILDFNMLLMKAIVVITIGITLASGRKRGNGILTKRSNLGKFHFMLFSSLCQVKRTDFVSCFSVIVIVHCLMILLNILQLTTLL